MRIALTLIFIFFTKFAFADLDGTYICEGFCENEKHDITYWSEKDKDIAVVKGKKKKINVINVYSGTRIENSPCDIFTSFITTDFSNKKYLKVGSEVFDQGERIINAHFEIGSCAPIPVSSSLKSKSGFYSHPVYTLQILFKNDSFVTTADAYANLNNEYFKNGKIGRDLPENFKYSEKLWSSNMTKLLHENTFYEFIKFTIAPKKTLDIIRIVANDEDAKEFDSMGFKSHSIYSASITEYKTAFREIPIKSSKPELIYPQHDYLITFLDNFIENFMTTYLEVMDRKHSNYENTEILFDFIPTKENMTDLEDYFEGGETFQIQTRN